MLCRYVDICLGLSLLLSHLLLSYGSVQERRHTVMIACILSMAVLVLYWLWFAYLKYGKGESEASKEVMTFPNYDLCPVENCQCSC